MNEAVNRALTLRKEKILKFGTTAAECVKMCESRCDEFEKGKNIVPERDYKDLERLTHYQRRTQGLPASHGPPSVALSDDSELSDDDYEGSARKGRKTKPKTVQSRKGKSTNKSASTIGRKPRTEKQVRRAGNGKGKGKGKEVIIVDEESSDDETSDDEQSKSQTSSRSGPISDVAQAKINSFRDRLSLGIKELAEETGKSPSWIEKQLFGHSVRQRSMNDWNAFLAYYGHLITKKSAYYSCLSI